MIPRHIQVDLRKFPSGRKHFKTYSIFKMVMWNQEFWVCQRSSDPILVLMWDCPVMSLSYQVKEVKNKRFLCPIILKCIPIPKTGRKIYFPPLPLINVSNLPNTENKNINFYPIDLSFLKFEILFWHSNFRSHISFF